jgi:hypothetical protein
MIEAQHSRGSARFRVLRADTLAGLVELAQTCEGAARYAAMAALVGAAWMEPDPPDTKCPRLHRATRGEVLDYGDAVIDEMDTAGMSPHVDIPTLWQQVVVESAGRHNARLAPFAAEVTQEQVDFSSPPPAGPNGSPPT